MKQDLIQILPSEIIFNILSRLPVRGIATCKCVRKSWLDLLSTVYFGKSYLSKSSALAVLMKEEQNSVRCRVYEFEDADEADEFEDADDDDDADVVVDRRYNPLTNFDFHLRTNLSLVGAADGLLLLQEYDRTLYVCNPITREYIHIGCPVENHTNSFYGFGTSKISGQHKVVQILHDTSGDCGCKCDVNVYTLETGLWRRLEAPIELHYCRMGSYGAFVNGNLHWIGRESSRGAFITCFDLETERFSLFSAAPFGIEADSLTICDLEDYLCVRYVMLSEDHEFVIEIWLMKEYGVEESWTEEYTICYGPDYSLDISEAFYLVKVFKNGDVLIPGEDNGRVLFRYSKKSQTARKIGILQPQSGIYWSSWHLTPSFLSLRRNLGMANVITF